MTTVSSRVSLEERVASAIAASRDRLLSTQHPDGYWWAKLESNVTITSEIVLLHKIWGTEARVPLDKIKNYLLREQRAHGGWELFYADGGEVSVSVEAYMALRLLGVPVRRSGARARTCVHPRARRRLEDARLHEDELSIDRLLRLARAADPSALDHALA